MDWPGARPRDHTRAPQPLRARRESSQKGKIQVDMSREDPPSETDLSLVSPFSIECSAPPRALAPRHAASLPVTAPAHPCQPRRANERYAGNDTRTKAIPANTAAPT